MYGDNSRGFWRSVPLYLACYALWVGLSGLALWAAFQLLISVTDVVLMFSVNPWTIDLAEKVTVAVLGLIWLGWVIFLESYLRDGVPGKRLRSRAAKAVIIEVVGLGLAHTLQALP